MRKRWRCPSVPDRCLAPPPEMSDSQIGDHRAGAILFLQPH